MAFELAFQGSALSGWAAVSRGLAVNLIDLRRLIQKNMNLVGNAFSIRSDLLFVLPVRRTPLFVMENFEHLCKTRQSHLTSTHVPKRRNKNIFNAWLQGSILRICVTVPCLFSKRFHESIFNNFFEIILDRGQQGIVSL